MDKKAGAVGECFKRQSAKGVRTALQEQPNRPPRLNRIAEPGQCQLLYTFGNIPLGYTSEA